MLNHIVIMGRLTQEPELRYTSNQTPVVSLTVAVERDYSGQENERSVDYIDCIATRKTAENISKYFHKGTMAVVSGSLHIRDSTDRNGNRYRNVEISVFTIYSTERRKPAAGIGSAKPPEEKISKRTFDITADDFENEPFD